MGYSNRFLSLKKDIYDLKDQVSGIHLTTQILRKIHIKSKQVNRRVLLHNPGTIPENINVVKANSFFFKWFKMQILRSKQKKCILEMVNTSFHLVVYP